MEFRGCHHCIQHLVEGTILVMHQDYLVQLAMGQGF